jgi:hypothetical protein
MIEVIIFGVLFNLLGEFLVETILRKDLEANVRTILTISNVLRRN